MTASQTETKETTSAVELPPATTNLPAMPEDHHPAKTPKRDAPAPPTVLPQTKVGKLAAAITAVMSEVNVIAKRGYNRFHGYRFAQMQDVLQELTPLLAKHGLMIVQTEVGRAMFDDDRAVSVQYQFTIAHSSGEVWPERPLQTGLSRCRDSKGGFDDKALNKCHTAARKYFLMALFQIPTGDEDDADLGGNERRARRPASPARNVMLHDPDTGEITETAAPEQDAIAPRAADADPSRERPVQETPPRAAGAAHAAADLTMDEADAFLANAANGGMAQLERAWNELTTEQRKTLKVALERRHKPAALAADQKEE